MGITQVRDAFLGNKIVTTGQAAAAGWRPEAIWELAKLRRTIPAIWGR